MCLPTVFAHTSSAHLRRRKGIEKEERKWKEGKRAGRGKEHKEARTYRVFTIKMLS